MAPEGGRALTRDTAHALTPALSPARWPEVSRVVDAALDLPHAERDDFVRRTCAGDAALRADVERLLDACVRAEHAQHFLAEPATESAASLRVDVPDRAAAGEAVLATLSAALSGHYTIERELGRGGMATVYLARDLRHRRPVAMKVLRPDLAASVGAERFLREVEVASGLTHPHILPLHHSGAAEGLLYYVMPYVAGESLRDRLVRERQLPIDETVAVICALAGALDYAHRRGVVHRDVKPENVLLQEGQPLLADFGIALALGGAGGAGRDGVRMTATGLAVGTPQYMSPEQAAGDRVVGPPSDVYSLGAVAYELLAGEPPITGPTPEAVRARVLIDAPRPIRTVRDTVPAAVEAAILRALAKTPADRFRTAGDFAAALRAPALAGPRARAAPGRWRATATRLAVGAVGVAALGLTALAVSRSNREQADRPPATRRQLSFSGNAFLAAISPDGQFIAYGASADSTQHVVVQDLAGGAPDTIHSADIGLRTLEWSPDGTRLLLGGWNKAVVLARRGGPAHNVTAATSFPAFVFAHWLPDGSRVSLHEEVDTRRILVVDLETEDTVAIPIAATYSVLMDGSWSPDGRRFAVASFTVDSLPYAIRYAIRTVGLDGRAELVVEDTAALDSPHWSPSGDAVFYLRGTAGDAALWRAGVSARTGRPRGVPEELHRQLEVLPLSPTLFQQYSVTRDGRRRVYARGRRFSNLWSVEANGSRPQPRTTSLTSGTALRWSPRVSPDGNWIGFAQETRDGAELFRMPIDGGVAQQITVGARVWPGVGIAWSPDGGRMAFASVRGGRPRVWVAGVADGRQRSFERSQIAMFGGLTWAPGSRIAYRHSDTRNISLLDPASGTERFVFLDTTSDHAFGPQYSPDGSRLAIWWHRGIDNFGLWAVDLRDSSTVQLWPGTGNWPIGWSADGRYVYAGGPRIHRVDTYRRRPPEHVATAPPGADNCTAPAPRRPGAFVCAAFDYVSDVWMIENFDPGVP